MLKDLTADNIYIVCGHTDMRKSIDGLAALVQQQFQLDLFASSAVSVLRQAQRSYEGAFMGR